MKNNSNLKELLKRSMVCLPPSLIPAMDDIIDHIQPPSASTLSRYQMVLDASYCRVWHSKWKERFNKNYPVAVYASIDSSPQFGADWMISECRIVKDPVAVLRLCWALRDMLPDNQSKQSLRAWSRMLDPSDIEALRSKSLKLTDLVQKHSLLPTVVGGRAASVAHKLHCFLHSLKMDMGTWHDVGQFLSQLETMTTDQGTERLVVDVPTGWTKLYESILRPRLLDCDASLDSSLGISQPQCGLQRKRGPELSQEGADNVKRRPVLADVEKTAEAEEVVENDSEVDYSMMPQLVAHTPDIHDVGPIDDDGDDLLGFFSGCQPCNPDDKETVIDVSDDEPATDIIATASDACAHPGCGEAVHTVCMHCYSPLCAVHCGELSSSSNKRHVWMLSRQSRCHAHWHVPIGQRSLVLTPFGGALRCPCMDCREARVPLRCPCPGDFCSGPSFLLSFLFMFIVFRNCIMMRCCFLIAIYNLCF